MLDATEPTNATQPPNASTTVPMTPATIMLLSCLIGLLWLTTVPLTTALVATFFGTTWLAMLGGIVFFSHQVGSFLGVWAAGWIYDATKSYDLVWWISVALGVFAGFMHLPIKERPVPRLTGALQPGAA